MILTIVICLLMRLDLSMATLFKERTKVCNNAIQPLEPTGELNIELVLRAALRDARIKVVATGNRVQRHLITEIYIYSRYCITIAAYRNDGADKHAMMVP